MSDDTRLLQDELAQARARAAKVEAERDRLREALEQVDARAMMAGGGTGWGPLANIHDIARQALEGTSDRL